MKNIIETGYIRPIIYSSSTGNGLISDEFNTTSWPNSVANQLMYGGLVNNTEYIIDETKKQNLVNEIYYLPEKDYNRLHNSILNPSSPNKGMMDLFKEFESK